MPGESQSRFIGRSDVGERGQGAASYYYWPLEDEYFKVKWTELQLYGPSLSMSGRARTLTIKFEFGK